MIGDASFIEIGVPKGSRAREFFEKLFGWTAKDMGSDGFYFADPAVPLGLHANDDDAVMVVYFSVPDIDAAAGRVRELGGTAGEPGPEQEGFGRFVECRDTQGVRFGLRQAPGLAR
jgi:uncharacterized protein